MPVPVSHSPTPGDTGPKSAMKSNAALAGTTTSYTPPAGSGLTTLVPKGGDTLQTSLRKINGLLLQGAGGGGGGITTETDPLSVHTAGGTMTGPLVFDTSSYGAPTNIIRITNYYGTIDIWYNGGALTLGNHIFDCGDVNGFHLTADCDGAGGDNTGDFRLSSKSGWGIKMVDGTVTNRLHIVSGDLVVTQTAGPNVGKSVNLTTGKWA